MQPLVFGRKRCGARQLERRSERSMDKTGMGGHFVEESQRASRSSLL